MPTALVDLTRLKKLHCGLGQFALHLGRTLQSLSSPSLQTEFLVPRGARRLLRGPGESKPTDVHPARWWLRESPRRTLRRVLQSFRAAPRADLWHTIDHLSSYGPIDRNVPVILTVHDLNFPAARTPRQNRRSLDILQRRIDRATLLTTGSHFAARQIASQLDLSGREINVIYHGLCVRDATATASSDARPAFAPAGPYLFSIGEFRPFKNFHTLVGLLARLPRDLSLVIAGNNATPYADHVRAEIARWNLGDRVILPGVVNDAERQWLYERCEAFVFPSLAEGFGLPAIEAMSFGKPAFLAEATSLPEIGGPLAFYWREFDPEPMARVFEAGMQSFRSRPAAAAALRSHAAQFTWPAAAASYLALYADVLGLHNSARPAARAA
jgi:glycosyltransferase involved in cell wall biosynthesis